MLRQTGVLLRTLMRFNIPERSLVFAARQRRSWLERVVKWRVGCDDSLSLTWTVGDELSVPCLRCAETYTHLENGRRSPSCYDFHGYKHPLLLLCTHVEVECVAILSECVVLTSGSTLADEELTRACVREPEYACTAVYSEHFLYDLRLQRQVFYSSQERSTKLKAPILFSFSVFILEQPCMLNLSWPVLVCS